MRMMLTGHAIPEADSIHAEGVLRMFGVPASNGSRDRPQAAAGCQPRDR